MSQAIQDLKDFLSKSPSVVFPDEVLEYVDAIEAENAKLRELVDAWMGCGTRYHTMKGACPMFDENAKDFCKAEKMARELGIEVRV